eukprot:PhM_4_TR10494/c1_g5_i2/m.8996
MFRVRATMILLQTSFTDKSFTTTTDLVEGHTVQTNGPHTTTTNMSDLTHKENNFTEVLSRLACHAKYGYTPYKAEKRDHFIERLNLRIFASLLYAAHKLHLEAFDIEELLSNCDVPKLRAEFMELSEKVKSPYHSLVSSPAALRGQHDPSIENLARSFHDVINNTEIRLLRINHPPSKKGPRKRQSSPQLQPKKHLAANLYSSERFAVERHTLSTPDRGRAAVTRRFADYYRTFVTLPESEQDKYIARAETTVAGFLYAAHNLGMSNLSDVDALTKGKEARQHRDDFGTKLSDAEKAQYVAALYDGETPTTLPSVVCALGRTLRHKRICLQLFEPCGTYAAERDAAVSALASALYCTDRLAREKDAVEAQLRVCGDNKQKRAILADRVAGYRTAFEASSDVDRASWITRAHSVAAGAVYAAHDMQCVERLDTAMPWPVVCGARATSLREAFARLPAARRAPYVAFVSTADEARTRLLGADELVDTASVTYFITCLALWQTRSLLKLKKNRVLHFCSLFADGL